MLTSVTYMYFIKRKALPSAKGEYSKSCNDSKSRIAALVVLFQQLGPVQTLPSYLATYLSGLSCDQFDHSLEHCRRWVAVQKADCSTTKVFF